MIGLAVIVAIVITCLVGAWRLNRSPGARRLNTEARERDRDIEASQTLGWRYGRPDPDHPAGPDGDRRPPTT